MMQHSIDKELTEKGYSRAFIDQIVRGGLLSNYGQGAEIHGFVGECLQIICIIRKPMISG